MIEEFTAVPHARRGPVVLQRLGRSARIHPRRHRRRRMRRRSRLPDRFRTCRLRARSLSKRRLQLERGNIDKGRAHGVRIDAARRAGAAEIQIPDRARRSRTRSSKSSARSSTTRRYSSIPLSAANSRRISSGPTKKRASRGPLIRLTNSSKRRNCSSRHATAATRA